ncbi:ATP-binding cassette sub-family B member 10, mitochondrial isoform X1 [Heterocephalus glaber]|uniref:ATP-binding cassette sub-family B member 10, mitochondrial n=1 Tax=Heterocephalus glaber TaxID=10181 RepID=A0AAX6TMF6_HETGA|nr:ATP-binding cassette sub-family B member 10, mitochondrial isoform X1 [Heterocephalus glaber]
MGRLGGRAGQGHQSDGAGGRPKAGRDRRGGTGGAVSTPCARARLRVSSGARRVKGSGWTRRHARPSCLAGAASGAAVPGRPHVDAVGSCVGHGRPDMDPGSACPRDPAGVDGPATGAAGRREPRACPGAFGRVPRSPQTLAVKGLKTLPQEGGFAGAAVPIPACLITVGPVTSSLSLPCPPRLAQAAVGFLAVSSVITMSAPFFLGKIIDVIYTNPTSDYGESLTRLCLGLTCVFLCGAAANAVRVYLMQSSGQRIVNRLRTSLFSSVLRQEIAFFDKTPTGELINRLSSDTALLGRSVTENLSDGLRAGAQASVGMGMMFFVSPSLATFVLSVVPPVSILAVIYGRYLRKLSKATQDSLAQATQLAEERIGNLRTVRAFGKEMTEVEKYTGRVDHVLQLARKEAFARAGFFGATGLSGNLIVLSVLYKGGLLMGSAHMTMGELSAFLMYAFWVGLSIGGLSSFYSELMKGLGAGGRLWELLERQPQLPFDVGVTLNEQSFQGALEFRNVHFAYPARPEVSIFQDFSLSIPSGSVTALVGSSGSGKSTVVSLLLRLYDPISGTISLDDHDIRQLNPVWLRSKIGTVSQEPILFSCSIAENIAYGADSSSSVTAEQVQRAAEVANAAGFIRSFPQGFDTMVGEKGVLLSGGQKQRIAIARALLKNPKILLLDEATSALDAENEHLVQEALDRLMEGRTVLIIAHRLSTIKNAHLVAVLDQGRIIEHGKHEELLSKPDGMYRKLMNKQSFISA